MPRAGLRDGAWAHAFRLAAALLCALSVQLGQVNHAHAAAFTLAAEKASVGEIDWYTTQPGDVLLDVARAHNLGYVQFMAANPGVDPWTPTPGTEVTLPNLLLLPDAPRTGIVVNLAWQRLFYFSADGSSVATYPLGVRRVGMSTPLGVGRITRKMKDPTWFPTASHRKDRPDLPNAIGPGPNNPLGAFALYLSWPTFLIHGTNNPYGVGRTTSRGCMRMYPEDVAELFTSVPVGTPVRIIDEEAAVAWVGDDLYVQVYPDQVQADEIGREGHITTRRQPANLVALVAAAADTREAEVDWHLVTSAGFERTGIAVKVARSPFGGGSRTISLR